MIAAIDSNVLGLAFLRGMVASINPCGFVLLPTYLLYFLGVQAAEQAGDQRASVRRALVVGSAVSAGFVAVFLVVGIVTETIDTWLLSNAKYATVVIGIGFVGARHRHARRLPAALRHAAPRRRRAHPQRRFDVRLRRRLRRGVAGLHDAAVPRRRCSARAGVRGSPPAWPTPCSTARGWDSSSSP